MIGGIYFTECVENMFDRKSNIEFCKVLLEKGAKVDARDSRNENTVMHTAALLRGNLT